MEYLSRKGAKVAKKGCTTRNIAKTLFSRRDAKALRKDERGYCYLLNFACLAAWRETEVFPAHKNAMGAEKTYADSACFS